MSSTRSGAGHLEALGELMRAATRPASPQQQLEGRARLIASVDRMHSRLRAKAALVAFATAKAASVLVAMRARDR